MRLLCLILLSSIVAPMSAQVVSPTAVTSPAPVARETVADAPAVPSRADVLRGAYGPFRANNDLLYYHLDVRVDPVAKSIAGTTTVRFRMLESGSRIQLDLTETLAIDGVRAFRLPRGRDRAGAAVKVTRDSGAVFLDLPFPLKAGQSYEVEVAYHGNPTAKGRFGGMSFEKDSMGRPWIFTACEDDGASIWWPNKDQWRDEPQDGMDISVAVPDGLTDVSNGRFVSSKKLGDGYTQWNWHVSYPINNYDVALNIGAYEHFSDTYKNAGFAPLTLDYYALPEDLAKAREQYPQAKGMLDAFEHYFGEYPFARDGYKLIQVPYAGMEHQSAVAYGNQFENGYLKRDWTGAGISPRFDFIIIHESGHEWFGNSVSAADRADMWIHEGWTTYMETLFVEFHYGKSDALKYMSGLIPKVHNRMPIVGERGVNADPPQDQYFKGALMIGTLRSIVDDDEAWFADIKAFYQAFQYRNIVTEDVIGWWNHALKMDLTSFFHQYLRHTAVPCLELNFDEAAHTVMYKWQADEVGFAMPVKVGEAGKWLTIHPTTSWQMMSTPLTKEQFVVATDLFFVNVSKT